MTASVHCWADAHSQRSITENESDIIKIRSPPDETEEIEISYARRYYHFHTMHLHILELVSSTTSRDGVCMVKNSGQLCNLLPLEPLALELQCPAILSDSPYHILRDTGRNLSFNLKCHSHIRPHQACQMCYDLFTYTASFRTYP